MTCRSAAVHCDSGVNGRRMPAVVWGESAKLYAAAVVRQLRGVTTAAPRTGRLRREMEKCRSGQKFTAAKRPISLLRRQTLGERFGRFGRARRP